MISGPAAMNDPAITAIAVRIIFPGLVRARYGFMQHDFLVHNQGQVSKDERYYPFPHPQGLESLTLVGLFA
jgi:hypothetical protein